MTLFRWLPPIRVADRRNSANGSSNALWITMYGNPNSTAAVLAQEIAEFEWKWTRLYAPGLALLGLLAWLIDPLVLALAAPLLVAQRLPPIRRALELWGHECEVQAELVLYDGDPADVRWREAMALRQGYAGIFDGWSVTRIASAMADRTPAAKRRVARMLPLLNAYRSRWR